MEFMFLNEIVFILKIKVSFLLESNDMISE